MNTLLPRLIVDQRTLTRAQAKDLRVKGFYTRLLAWGLESYKGNRTYVYEISVQRP